LSGVGEKTIDRIKTGVQEIADSNTEAAPELTFGPSAAETVLEDLGFAVDDGGIIVDETGDPVEPAFGDAPISVDNLGGFAKDESGEIVVIGDDFPSLVEYVKQFEVSDNGLDSPTEGGTDAA
jgi:hypothetical protein